MNKISIKSEFKINIIETQEDSKSSGDYDSIESEKLQVPIDKRVFFDPPKVFLYKNVSNFMARL